MYYNKISEIQQLLITLLIGTNQPIVFLHFPLWSSSNICTFYVVFHLHSQQQMSLAHSPPHMATKKNQYDIKYLVKKYCPFACISCLLESLYNNWKINVWWQYFRLDFQVSLSSNAIIIVYQASPRHQFYSLYKCTYCSNLNSICRNFYFITQWVASG